METEMGQIQDEHRRKASPQQCRDGACMVTAAPQRLDPAEDDGLNLPLNSTWGVCGTDRLPVSVEVQAKWKGRLDSACTGGTRGQPKDSVLQ